MLALSANLIDHPADKTSKAEGQVIRQCSSPGFHFTLVYTVFIFTSLLAGPQLTATISEAIPFSLSLTACCRKRKTETLHP